MNTPTLRRVAIPAVALLTLGLTLSACGDKSTSDSAAGPGGGGTLNGGGSTAQAVAEQAWRANYQKQNGGTINYEEVGSGTGVENFISGAYAFAGSDAYLTPDQVSQAKQQCGGDPIEVPAYVSPLAVAFNLPGIKSLNLDGETIAKIFNGSITTWNDPAIASQNSGVKLPSTSISTVHRSDDSGTTFNFTDYLSSVSAAWRARVGKGTAVDWPVGVGGKGSSGVAAVVAQTPGAIGYADVAYALKSHLSYFRLKNRSGRYAVPALRGILSAASSDQKPAADNSLSIVDPPKKFANAYPISTFTYVIVPLQTAKAADLKKLLIWALTHGQSYGPKLLFQPLPRSVLRASERAVKKIHT